MLWEWQNCFQTASAWDCLTFLNTRFLGRRSPFSHHPDHRKINARFSMEPWLFLKPAAHQFDTLQLWSTQSISSWVLNLPSICCHCQSLMFAWDCLAQDSFCDAVRRSQWWVCGSQGPDRRCPRWSWDCLLQWIPWWGQGGSHKSPRKVSVHSFHYPIKLSYNRGFRRAYSCYGEALIHFYESQHARCGEVNAVSDGRLNCDTAWKNLSKCIFIPILYGWSSVPCLMLYNLRCRSCILPDIRLKVRLAGILLHHQISLWGATKPDGDLLLSR